MLKVPGKEKEEAQNKMDRPNQDIKLYEMH